MRLSEIDKGPALFLDDEREPPMDGHKWVLVRSFDQAKRYVESHGMPPYASFDHDLGDGQTGYDFIKWLVEHDMEKNVIKENFDYYVHSQNPIGVANIRGYLSNYLEVKNGKEGTC